mgnify:CR=1 FL=1
MSRQISTASTESSPVCRPSTGVSRLTIRDSRINRYRCQQSSRDDRDRAGMEYDRSQWSQPVAPGRLKIFLSNASLRWLVMYSDPVPSSQI